MGPIKVLLIDDHELIARGLRGLTEGNSQISLISHAKTEASALEVLEENPDTDVILVDLFLGYENPQDEPGGLQICRKIMHEYNRGAGKKIKLIIITGSKDGIWICEARSIGVRGYLFKNCRGKELINAIKAVARDQIYFRGEVQKKWDEYYIMVHTLPNVKPRLTKVEKEVLEYSAYGMTAREIAKKRNVAIGVIELHHKNLREKFQASNVANLIYIASVKGYI